MTAFPPLTAVVVHFRSAGTIVDTCRDLSMQDHPALDIVIVECGDDGSTSRAVRAAGDTATVVINPQANLGYCGGNNIGFAKRPVRGDVLVVNPDVRIYDSRALSTMHRALAGDPGLAAVGPAILRTDGLLEHADSRFDPDDATAIHTRTSLAEWPADLSAELHEVPWLDGCCWLIRKEAIENVGGLDERFFLYCEEVDWSRRAVTAGWRLAIVPAARVEHDRSSSFRATQKGSYYYWRNNYLLFRRHATSRRWVFRWLRRLIRFSVDPSNLRSGASANAVWGLFDAVRGRTGPRPGRGRA